MQMKRAGRIQYLEVVFSGSSCSAQGFTTRHEGVSRPPYNSLNLGTTTLDQPHNVEGNRNLLARAFGIPQESLLTVRQTHGSDILVINEPNEDLSHFAAIESDAVITDQPGLMLAVTVADCVPILLFDPVKKVIAAVHAGWKGSAAALAAKTVAGMASVFGCDPAAVQAAIGPCIKKCCYEIDLPVKNAFNQSGLPWESVAEQEAEGKWRLDMAAANRELLLKAGLREESIQVSELCVSCHRELFFSYRRDNGETGRQMGFIVLNS